MREIMMVNGLVAQVDDQDFARLSPHKWYTKRVHKTYHAFRFVGDKRVTMHHEVLGITDGSYIYHLDHNGLNNQRSNLCRQDKYERRRPQREKRPQATSQYRGVAWVGSRRMWLAYIFIRGKTRHLGLHEHEEDAARHYDREAIKHFDNAALNFPERSNT
jgi:hypothetical protein